MSGPGLRRTIGLPGAVFTLVGYVIGASIFVLPGQLAARAGPGLFLAYLLAGGLALLTCLASAHIGSTLPVSGAAYVAVSRTVGPAWGFLVIWYTIGAVVVAEALVAYGLADYLAYFAPELPRRVVAVTAVVAFGGLNLVSVRGAVAAQVAMTGLLLVIILGFGVAAVAHVQPDRLSPLLPNGITGLLVTAVTAYFSFTGFTVIAEIAEEIRDPGRTIPRALAASFLVVTVAYLLIAVAVPGLLDWRTLADVPAPVATAAETFLPSAGVGVIAVGAMLAAATSIHGMLLVQSRDVYALARDRLFPDILSRVQSGSAIPAPAVVLLTALSVAGVLAGGSIVEYATVAVLGVMVVQGLIALAVMRLPRSDEPGRFGLAAAARQRLGIVLFVVSLLFAGVGLASGGRSVAAFAGLTLMGGVYFQGRRRFLARRGIHIADLLAGPPHA
ncbi:MAG TPA: APC family permease [Gemmatimonadales bacterium]